MRQGISFTMTLIIVAVVLLVGSVTVLSLFGSGMTDFFNVLDSSTTTTAVEQQCQQVKRELQRKVCDAYVTDDYGSYRYEQSAKSGHIETCNEKRCSFEFSQGQEVFSYDVYDTTTETNDNREIPLTVTVEGDTYNCYDQNYLPQTCPVQ